MIEKVTSASDSKIAKKIASDMPNQTIREKKLVFDRQEQVDCLNQLLDI